MNDTIHLGIVGLRHSGKTHLARELLNLDDTAKRIALAMPLKAACAEMCSAFLYGFRRGLPASAPAVITIEDIEAHKAIFRPLLQWVGTEFARQYIGPNTFWIDRFREVVGAAEKYRMRVICDDVRFPNEAEALRAMGFRIVKIVRPEADRLASLERAGEKPEHSAHASETEIAKIIPDLTFDAPSLDAIHDIACDLLTHCRVSEQHAERQARKAAA